MDAQGIDVEALSINPYWYTVEHDLARQIILHVAAHCVLARPGCLLRGGVSYGAITLGGEALAGRVWSAARPA